MSMYSLTGVKVADCGTKGVAEGNNSIHVSAALPKGLYVLRVTGKGGSSSVNVVYI